MTVQALDNRPVARKQDLVFVYIRVTFDQDPYFDPAVYTTTAVAENAAVGTRVLLVTALDNDLVVRL